MATTPFGPLPDGRTVTAIALKCGPWRATILTLGAILQDLRTGTGPGLTAGSPSLAAYTDGPLAYAGAIVGPVANRIGSASAVLDGQKLQFEANSAGGHHLHGGAEGLHGQVWEIIDQAPERVTLAIALAPGQGGLPGARRITAAYSLTAGTLTLDLTATTDAPTLMAPANHSYWTLGAPSVDALTLTLDAQRYLPTDPTALPTGHIATVENTRFDFRQARHLGPDDRLDTCFCLSDGDLPLRPVARLASPDWAMDLATTAPGLQAFTADPFAAPGPMGHDGHRYGPRFALALEAQAWPNAANVPRFPPIRVTPDRPFTQTTRWSFQALT